MKKKNLLLIIGLMLMIVLAGGLVSYAYWMVSHTQDGDNILLAGCFETSFTEESSSISLKNAFPVTDSQGSVYEPYVFTIKNTCTYDSKFQINFETINTSTLSVKNVKLKVNELEPQLVSDYTSVTPTLENGSDARSIATGILAGGQSITYEIRMWLDRDATAEEAQNKSYASKIVVITSMTDDFIQFEDGIIASAPELYKGLIPVTYDSNGNVVVADMVEKWYDYESREWANAVLVNNADSTIKDKYFDSEMNVKDSAAGTIIPQSEILQMYVWIPRYRYQLFNANNGTSTVQAVNIEFQSEDDTKYEGTANGEWLTHPAFTFGEKELNGFWVGKFEMSGTTTNPTIKPNQYSLTNLNISTMFSTLQNMVITDSAKYGINSGNVDPHMMKNSEWGAVAFLTNSIYGRYIDESTCIASGCEVWINNVNTGYGNGTAVTGMVQWGPSVTGCAGSGVSVGVSSSQTACATGYDWTANGVNASTTGNIYGVYDMSGGAWEYVMGAMYDTDGSSMLYKSSGFTAATQPAAKYYDIYNYQATDNYVDSTTISRMHLGDATKEIMTTNTAINGAYGWNGDYTYTTSAVYPWVARGGSYSYGTTAGVFHFLRSPGAAYTNYSFRSVLAAL